MISTSLLHKKLAQILGDTISPSGEEVIDLQDGVRYTYEQRKSAIEFALGQIIINTQDNAVLNQFLKIQNLINPIYSQIGNIHKYEFNLPENVARVDFVIIKKDDYRLTLYSGFPTTFLYGVGLGIYYIEVNKIIILIGQRLHINSSDEVQCEFRYFTSEGWGDVGKFINLPSFYEDMILNMAYLNLINREVKK